VGACLNHVSLVLLCRHARTCCGHPHLWAADKSWMAGTSPAMTTDVTEYDRNML
jgi:hypothetical protein